MESFMLNFIYNLLNPLGSAVTRFLATESKVVHKALLGVFHTDAELQKYMLIGWAGIVLVGIFLGFCRKIVIYEDFDTVAHMLYAVVLPVIVCLLVAAIGVQTNTKVFRILEVGGWSLEGLYLLGLYIQCLQSNRDPIRATIAFVTKFTLSAMLLLGLYTIFSGGNKQKLKPGEQAPLIDKSILTALVGTGLLAALIYKLVANKDMRQVARNLPSSAKRKQEVESDTWTSDLRLQMAQIKQGDYSSLDRKAS